MIRRCAESGIILVIFPEFVRLIYERRIKQRKEDSRMEEIEAAYRAYYDDVFRFLRGLTGSESLAEELTQETFFQR